MGMGKHIKKGLWKQPYVFHGDTSKRYPTPFTVAMQSRSNFCRILRIRDAALQGEYESGWSIRSEDINADSPGQNFYIKTDSQLYSGVGFETADGKFC